MTSVAVSLLLGASLLGADAQSTGWHNDYWVAKRACLRDGKPMLIVFDVAGDDQQQIHQASSRPQGSNAQLSDRYVRVHIDAGTEYGKKVAGFFRARQFPFTAVTDNRVKRILYRKTGSFSEGEWQAMLTGYQHGRQVTYRSSQSYRQPAYCST